MIWHAKSSTCHRTENQQFESTEGGYCVEFQMEKKLEVRGDTRDDRLIHKNKAKEVKVTKQVEYEKKTTVINNNVSNVIQCNFEDYQYLVLNKLFPGLGERRIFTLKNKV